MERVNREDLGYTVETTSGFSSFTCVNEEAFCTWKEAYYLFNQACADEEVSSCTVYYWDSKRHRREVLTYTAPLDY